MPNTRNSTEIGSPDAFVELKGKFRVNVGAQILGPGQTDVPTLTSVAAIGSDPTNAELATKLNEVITKLANLDLQLIALGVAKSP